MWGLIKICHMTIIHFTQKIGKHQVILNTCLWLQAASYDKIKNVPIWRHFTDEIHSVHKEITK